MIEHWVINKYPVPVVSAHHEILLAIKEIITGVPLVLKRVLPALAISPISGKLTGLAGRGSLIGQSNGKLAYLVKWINTVPGAIAWTETAGRSKRAIKKCFIFIETSMDLSIYRIAEEAFSVKLTI